MNVAVKIIFCLLSALMTTDHATGDDVKSTYPKLADSINRFGIKLFTDMSGVDANILISPFSLSAALNALYIGSSGKTAEEISNVMGFKQTGLTRTQINEAYQSIFQQQRQTKYQYEANYANSIWFRNGISVQPAYKSDIQKYFYTEEKEVDFANPSSTNDINAWTDKQTKNIAPKVFNSELDSKTSIVLASGNFFKGKWATAFTHSETKSEPFFLDGGNTSVQVQMMHIDGMFSYANDIDINSEVIEIPFDGNDITMVIVLPKSQNGIRNQEKFFTLENVNLALREMSLVKVHFRMPKFNLSMSHNLNENLKKMGIQEAFTNGAADFSKIDGQKDLTLSQVVEAGSIEINEDGTATAPTITKDPKLAYTGYDFPKEEYVTCDHPFGFLIRNKNTGVILFIGRVWSP